MSSLFGAMSIATGALEAEQGALNATTNNVANVNTPGYSRLQPILVESSPITVGSVTYGSGVSLQALQGLRDPILQLRIQEETQQQGQLNASLQALQQTQVQFTTSSDDIGTEISNFFSSLAQISTDPTNLGLRQGALTAAGNMTTAFNNVASNLGQQRSSLDQGVSQDVQQVNVLTAQIDMAKVLSERNYNIRIEGHTDDVPIHNPQYASNWELSTARSTEMVRLLITRYGFSPELLSAAGYAEFHPIASNDTEAGRALNRRVDVVILAQPRAANAQPARTPPQ